MHSALLTVWVCVEACPNLNLLEPIWTCCCCRLRQGTAGFEDGTLPFLAIAALSHGFAAIERAGGMDAITQRCKAITRFVLHRTVAGQPYTRNLPFFVHNNSTLSPHTPVCRRCVLRLQTLSHSNGAPVVHLYGAHAAAKHPSPALGLQAAVGQGPVIAFNLLRPDGSWVGYREVERLAALRGITLRTGCCCNPGACAAAVGLDDAAMLANHRRGHVCWDAHDLMDGVPTGVVRASFGWMSTDADVDALVGLVQDDFVCRGDDEESGKMNNGGGDACVRPSTVSISELWVYPVKSCRGQRVDKWPLGPRGLLFDREWAVEDGCGRVLVLKNCPQLARIEAVVSMETLSLRCGDREMVMSVQEDGTAASAWLTVRLCWSMCSFLLVQYHIHLIYN